jgi:LCP family protein required for cell wall assembly
MTANTTRFGRVTQILSWILGRFVPFILLLAVIWSGFQLLRVTITQVNRANELSARQADYALTATAIAPADSGALRQVLVAQFATNTPIGAQPTPENTGNTGSGGVFATNTPAFVAPTPTTIPTEVPVQATAIPLQSTPFVVPTFFPAAAADIAQIAGTAVPTPVPLIPRNYELVNIMLMGGDDEVSQDGTVRTDTMIIVSINTQTRTVSMLSLPRDLFVYVPTPTMTRLNTVYGIGESFGWQGGGWELLRETIFYNFGINVHYYAKVDFSGFETIIDTLGGVDIAVDCTYEDYYPKAVIDPNKPVEENYELRTLPVGYYRMNGFDALWYSRTRRVSDEFDRGRRQQKMLRAIFRAALAQGLVQNVPQLWGDITQVVKTDIPFDLVLGLLPIALEINPDKIENYTMVRTYHTTPWQPTEGAFAGQFVQLPVYEPIRQLLTEFYEPPTSSQVTASTARVAVYNGTSNPDWDKVAVEKLREVGIASYAAGNAPTTDFTDTVVIDRVGDAKSSPVPLMIDALNGDLANVTLELDPNRTEDYTIIVGANYNSCDAAVISPDQVGN